MSAFHYSVSIHPDRINLFRNSIPGTCRKSRRQIVPDFDSESLISKPKKVIKYTTDGKLSKTSSKKLSRAITYINEIAKETKQYLPNRQLPINFKLSFITLTLCSKQVHTDQYLRRHLLTDFFVRAKIKWNLKNYVWRAEKQKNGNIHFHLVTDCFIPHNELKVVWNNLLDKLGYIDEFAAKYKHRQPNSTDIHSLRFIKDIVSYLTKYLVKSEQNKGLTGRLYGTSKSLENLKGAKDDVSSCLSEELNEVVSDNKVRVVKGDYYEVYFLPRDFWITKKQTILFELLNLYFQEHFDIEFKQAK
jgi:hypothetical protein